MQTRPGILKPPALGHTTYTHTDDCLPVGASHPLHGMSARLLATEVGLHMTRVRYVYN